MQHATNSILKIVKVSKEVKLGIYSTVRHRKSSYAVKNDLKFDRLSKFDRFNSDAQGT